MEDILVVAGTQKEFEEWCWNNNLSFFPGKKTIATGDGRRAIYCTTEDQLRGWGSVNLVRCGSWKKNSPLRMSKVLESMAKSLGLFTVQHAV